MARRIWAWNPHIGGTRIPPAVRERTERRIRTHAESRYAGTFTELSVRFHGALCYVDALTEPERPSRALLRALGETQQQYMARVRAVPLHLCRLRYFGNEDAWSLAFFAYSSETYEPCVFPNGGFHGTPEAALDVGAVYLRGTEVSPRRRGRRTRS
jgi:hypothetical protein